MVVDVFIQNGGMSNVVLVYVIYEGDGFDQFMSFVIWLVLEWKFELVWVVQLVIEQGSG